MATGAATLIGGALALRFKERLYLILGFSAGAVIGVALFDLLPEALKLGAPGRTPLTTLAIVGAGFAAYMLADRAMKADGTRGAHLGAASLTLHSLMDGVGIGLAFQVSTAVGAVVAAAVLAHDFADGVNTVNVALSRGAKPKVARAWLFADAAAPLAGILLTRLVAAPQGALSLLIALFTGFFLYIGAGELVPTSHQNHPRFWTSAATVLGMALIYAAVRWDGP